MDSIRKGIRITAAEAFLRFDVGVPPLLDDDVIIEVKTRWQNTRRISLSSSGFASFQLLLQLFNAFT